MHYPGHTHQLAGTPPPRASLPGTAKHTFLPQGDPRCAPRPLPAPQTPTCEECGAPPWRCGAGGGLPRGAYTAAHRGARSGGVILSAPLVSAGRGTAAPADPAVEFASRSRLPCLPPDPVPPRGLSCGQVPALEPLPTVPWCLYWQVLARRPRHGGRTPVNSLWVLP